MMEAKHSGGLTFPESKMEDDAMRSLMLLVALVVGGMTKLLAQAEVPRDSAAIAGLADQIRSQGRIRVRLVNYNDLELFQPRLVEGSLRFVRFEPGGQSTQSSPDSLQVLPLMEVTRIQVRKSAAGKGAVIGLIVGGVTMAAVNLSGSPPQWEHSETSLFAILGAGLGAVVGALVGAQFRTWSTIYEASASR